MARSIPDPSGSLLRPAIPEIFSVNGKRGGCCTGKLKPEAPSGISFTSSLQYETYSVTATYYSLNGGLKTTLMLNNKGPEPIQATPTFYSLAGTRLRLAPITVPGASYIDVDMHVLLAEAAEEFREGSLKIAYQGGDYQLGAQVRMVDEQNSLIWAEHLVYTSKFVSNRLENVWWLPGPNMQTRLVVSNTSYSPVTVTLAVDGTVPQQTAPVQITLAKSETRVLDIMADLVGVPSGILDTKGGVSISHTGNPGAVLARMFISKPSSGYSAAINFVDPEATASQKWHGNGLRIRNLDGTSLKPVLVARNTTGQMTQIRGRIPYTRPDGEMGYINIPNAPFPANTTRVVNLQGRIASANLPASVTFAGIELEYDAPKGTLITQVQSVSNDGNHVFQVPMFDPAKMPSSAGGFPWKADGDFRTVVYIKNETAVARKYTVHLLYEGGQYSLGVNDIKPHQTVAVDFSTLRDDQTPDALGRVIPLNAVTGQIAWSVKGGENHVLSGRSEQISLENGIASTYSCANCCPDSAYHTGILPMWMQLAFGTTSFMAGQQTDISCNGTLLGPYIPGGIFWNSDNVNVVTADGGYLVATGVGTATISATWETCLVWIEEGHCSLVCDPTTQYASVEVVRPTVNSISASIASTKNPTVQATPPPGNFTSTVSSVAFPTETTTQMMVVFQHASEPITIKAEGINPPSAGNQLKWKIDRNPADTVAIGTPSLSTQTGTQLTLTPTTAGSFRLISYFDTNESGDYDTGEEAGVILLAIIRVSISGDDCTIDSPMASFSGGPDKEAPAMFGVTPGPLPMAMNCEFLIEGGGANKRIGTSQVHFGNVGNLSANTAKVNYTTAGIGKENPGGASSDG